MLSLESLLMGMNLVFANSSDGFVYCGVFIEHTAMLKMRSYFLLLNPKRHCTMSATHTLLITSRKKNCLKIYQLYYLSFHNYMMLGTILLMKLIKLEQIIFFQITRLIGSESIKNF
uniref:Uncharacterized protein n=1 Tax=Arundo donax TaxID=35708 RepID=A0A0A9DE64_ARUDO